MCLVSDQMKQLLKQLFLIKAALGVLIVLMWMLGKMTLLT
jgi:hypothetical protein